MPWLDRADPMPAGHGPRPREWVGTAAAPAAPPSVTAAALRVRGVGRVEDQGVGPVAARGLVPQAPAAADPAEGQRALAPELAAQEQGAAVPEPELAAPEREGP